MSNHVVTTAADNKSCYRIQTEIIQIIILLEDLCAPSLFSNPLKITEKNYEIVFSLKNWLTLLKSDDVSKK
jgi:hypothetical protein